MPTYGLYMIVRRLESSNWPNYSIKKHLSLSKACCGNYWMEQTWSVAQRRDCKSLSWTRSDVDWICPCVRQHFIC